MRVRPGWARSAAVMVLAWSGLLLSGVVVAAGGAGTGPAGAEVSGCGAGGGDCGAVWSTRYGEVAGVSVGWPAAGVYLAALLWLAWARRGGDRRGAASGAGGMWCQAVAGACGTALLGTAVYFTALQIAVLQRVCPLCLMLHAVGTALGLVLLWRLPGRARVVGGGVGLAGVGVLAAVQWLSPGPGGGGETGAGGAGADQLTAATVAASASIDGRRVTLLEGRLTLDLDQEIWLHRDDATDPSDGDPANPSEAGPTGDAVVVELFDYGCHHCRRLHERTRGWQKRPMVLVPVPLGKACNPYLAAQRGGDLYPESCELARLAWAVWRVEPRWFPAFHDWMFGEGWPRTLAEARTYARQHVDLGDLNRAMQDPAGSAYLQRNVEAWGSARDRGLVGGLPVLLTSDGVVLRNPDAEAARPVLEER